jgi:ribosomal protein L37AE/L43A
MTTERWRYCCPECESHTLVSLVSGGYRCDVCGTAVERRYDKKYGKLTA